MHQQPSQSCILLTKYVSFQARQISIHNLTPFYASDIFQANSFHVDAKRKMIIHNL